MTYLEALYEFALQLKPLDEINYPNKNGIFLCSSAIVAFLMILVDVGAYYLKKKSFLGMHYNEKSKYFLIIITWTFASTCVSYLGLIMQIFNNNIQSCVIVGAAWLLLFAKIANQKVGEGDDIQN